MKKSTVIALVPPLVMIAPAFASAETSAVTEIIESDDWLTLKSIWQLANGINPQELNPSPTEFGSFPLATEKGDSILTQLNSLFQEPLDNPELDTALQLTKRIATLRITRLSRMNMMYMTRMMPPWTDVVQDEMVFNFESRLTELDSLLEEKEITPTEFINARETLLLKAETIAILELINQTGREVYRFSPNDYQKVNTDIILEQLDLSYRAALDTLAHSSKHLYTEHYESVVTQHEIFLERYEEFTEAKPIFRLLLTDLMEPQL